MNFKKIQLLHLLNPHTLKNSGLFIAKTELCCNLVLKHIWSQKVCLKKVFQRKSDLEISGFAIREKIAMSKP